MIIVAILKHVAGKSADYGAALDYLKYEHDEVLKRPLLDANGNWVLRRDILLEGINCEPELFDVECEMLNAQYHKNQNYDEIKTHHYLISFDPADKDECGLTGEQAQAIGMEYVKANFPGHQALVCTHMDGHNGSGNIHVHIVINSLRKLNVPQQPFMERPIDCKAGYKHHLTKDYLKHLQQSLMNIVLWLAFYALYSSIKFTVSSYCGMSASLYPVILYSPTFTFSSFSIAFPKSYK